MDLWTLCCSTLRQAGPDADESNQSDKLMRDAVRQIRVCGYPVREVSRRLGLSSHAIHKWLRLLAKPAPKLSSIDCEAESRCLKHELARAIGAREILKKVS